MMNTVLDRLAAHTGHLKTHIMDAHDALTECAVELAALEESGRIQLHVNEGGVRALLFSVAESAPPRAGARRPQAAGGGARNDPER